MMRGFVSCSKARWLHPLHHDARGGGSKQEIYVPKRTQDKLYPKESIRCDGVCNDTYGSVNLVCLNVS